ncbi:PfkB family carbohydrate kinase, partial [Staphylococcus gallinarum]|uniref:PfkB family carbohydrate kinase n=1 Tax=Staphylococcus gallinarum TaxID=1293 RepID=UPI001F545AD4
KLASEIRKHDPVGNIIFVTSHSELTYLTFVYKVAAMDFIFKDGTIIEQQGIKVKAIDTTGAGDAFIGALISRLLISDSTDA